MIIRNILQEPVTSIRKDLVWQFGDHDDGAIEFAGLVERGIVEVGYFYGKTKPKNIIVISSQVGCPVGCTFCPLGDARGINKFRRNLTAEEIFEQVVLMLRVAREHSIDIENIEHKVTFAKTGEPLLNPDIISSIMMIAILGFSFKFSTVFPRGTQERLLDISKAMRFYIKPVQLQISLISTVEDVRNTSTRMKLASFEEISQVGRAWKHCDPFDRKINLSLMMADESPFNFDVAERFFSPDIFRFRLRMYVPNENGENNDLTPVTRERYTEINSRLKELGYEVGDWAVPTPIEQRFGLASNVTRSRYCKMISGEI